MFVGYDPAYGPAVLCPILMRILGWIAALPLSPEMAGRLLPLAGPFPDCLSHDSGTIGATSVFYAVYIQKREIKCALRRRERQCSAGVHLAQRKSGDDGHGNMDAGPDDDLMPPEQLFSTSSIDSLHQVGLP